MLLILAVLFAACQTNPPPASRSAWGEVFTIAQAPQSNAPAIWADPSHLVAAWTGSDSAGVHQDMRLWAENKFSPITVLPLPPTHPYAQSLVTGYENNLHLFWLDEAANGMTQVFSALLDSQLSVERGPTPVSEALALRYAVAPGEAGRAWVAWSGGALQEPILYLQSLDETGRPQPPQALASNADYPALGDAGDGILLLFWLERGQLMRAVIANGAVVERSALTSAVYLGDGDRLRGLSAGLDSTHAYVFWNITRASSGDETWLASGSITASSWSAPEPLGAQVLANLAFDTGFNTGIVNTAHSGETPLTWATPLSGRYETLPAAVQSPNGLAVIYFQSGAIRGYQDIFSDTILIGIPALTTDHDHHLYLAWSQPSPTGVANLLFTTTHP
jgi:hypothetical protein